MEKVIASMREFGFDVGEPILIADGKVHRFKRNPSDNRKSAWYIAFTNFRPKTGEEFHVVQFGDWRENSEYTINTLGDKALDKAEKKLFKEAAEKASKQREAEKAKLQIECANESAKVWQELKTSGRTPYLDKKQIEELYGAKIGTAKLEDQTFTDVLFVPVQDLTGKVWGFQKIFPNGTKKLSFGVKIKGNFFLFGKPDGADLYVCEGFATAASVHKATGRPTVCAFFASNLPDVCRLFNSENEVIICGDDDRFTSEEKGGNAGRKAADKAPCSKAVFPSFSSDEGEPTDFNDLQVREGLEVVRAQLANVERGEYVSALGYKGTRYFYRSSENLQIVSIPRESFTRNSLRDLIGEAYFVRNYPDERGNVNWDWAFDDLMRRGRRKGIFDETRIRGVGVWKDGGRNVINLGDSLYYDGQKFPLDSLKDSNYIYEQGRKMSAPVHAPLDKNEGFKLKRIFDSLLWKTPDAGKILCGWVVVAPFAGVLDWRSHVWITGPKGSGKSYIMDNIVNPLIRDYRNYFLGQTTEAGVRQTQKSDARPVQFDEFETDDERSSYRIQSLLELFRQASSESEGFVVKGTPGGSALTYRPRFSVIVSSIRVGLVQGADESRFCVLELKELSPNEKNSKQFDELKELIKSLPDDYPSRLFSRTYFKLDVLKKNVEILWKVLRSEYTPRIAQQYSGLLAGYHLLTNDDPLNEEQALDLVRSINFEESKSVINDSEQEDCLDHLFRKIISYKLTTGATGEDAIGNFVYQAWQEGTPRAEEVLALYGIAVDKEGGFVYIANKHSELKTLFRNTPWASGNWAKSISRIPGSEARVVWRIDKKPTRATKLSLNDIFKGLPEEKDQIPF